MIPYCIAIVVKLNSRATVGIGQTQAMLPSGAGMPQAFASTLPCFADAPSIFHEDLLIHVRCLFVVVFFSSKFSNQFVFKGLTWYRRASWENVTPPRLIPLAAPLWALLTTYYVPLTTYWLLLAIYHVATHYLLFITYYRLFTKF